jgi:hypothetical protein
MERLTRLNSEEYDARLGRFMAIDPLTKKYPELTPYQFAGNTPIWARELEGLESWYTNDGNKTSDEFGSGPQKEQAGPLSDENATEQGFSKYGVMETVKDYSFTDKEISNFAEWNEKSGKTEPGHCLGCAVTGAEKLTGADAGFRNSSGNNVLNGKSLVDLGTNLEQTGNATELPTTKGQETTTILNTPNATSVTQNTAFLLGPAGAFHSLILTHNISNNKFSIYDQHTNWDVKNATQSGAQFQINDIFTYPSYQTTQSYLFQLNKTSKIEVTYPTGNQ